MSEVEQFFENLRRLCDENNCRTCVFDSNQGICHVAPYHYTNKEIKEVIEKVNSWVKEHPYKRRLDDLLEKYPDFDLRNGYPMFYPRVFGYCQYECIKCDAYERGIEYCWNLPL